MPTERDVTDLSNQSTDRPLWRNIAAGGIIALAAVVACNKVRNFDTFWHLKSGQWMLENHRVLGNDIFTASESPDSRPGRWVNVHWGFQVIVAAVHWLGGWAGLVVLKMCVFAGAMAVFALWLRKRCCPALLIFAAMAIIIGIEDRVRVRPEVFTFLFFIVTLVLVESVRQGASPKRLWWLVAINIVWVNMHGLFIVGVAATWSAVAGAFIDRAFRRDTTGTLATGKALLPVIVATAACLISPWPMAAALHPLLLRTRVTGEQGMYTFGVSEFRPTYMSNIFESVSTVTALTLALAALEAMRVRRKSLPAGHVFWYLGFGALGVMAVRNVALFCIPAGFLLAVHSGQWWNEIRSRRPALQKTGAFASVIMLFLLAATAAGYATETIYRWQGREACRFGQGLVDGLHPVDMARWLGRSKLSGDILPLDFGDGGTFIYYSYPRRRVWMDGRLEVHPPDKLKRLQEIGRNMLSSGWGEDSDKTPLPPTVRFIVVRLGNTGHIKALNESRRFKLIYIDRVGVCFARLPMPGEKNAGLLRKWHAEEELPPVNVDRFDRAIEPASTGGLLPGVATQRRWYRQNVPPAHWNVGTLFFSLGLDNLAVRYLTVANRLGIREPVSRAGLLAEVHRRIGEFNPIEPERDLPVDPNFARALALLEKVDLTDLQSKQSREYALMRVKTLKQARQIDAADDAVGKYLENLPIPKRWHPSRSDLDLRDSLHAARRIAEATASQFNIASPTLTPDMRALLLLRRDVGLIDRAAAELESAGDSLPRQGRLLLGDLYLRKGLVEKARKAYESVDKQDGWDVRMRLGLCGWVAGDFAAAEADLISASRAAPTRPEPVIYLSLLYEQLGKYQSAADILNEYILPLDSSPDNQAVRLIRQIEARLRMRR
ncbi:MAG: hypothetical protein SVV80_04085 [Planctomycetota bacterium]|nr:hypothetical protein [Planctomycetota bacterium]